MTERKTILVTGQ